MIRHRIHRLTTALLLFFSTTILATTAQLMDGSVVDIGSPGSRVYIVQPDGDRHPLWNGTHQLNNGATLTIRGGVLATPPWSSQGRISMHGRCRTLVDKVCGVHGQCSEATACKLARQMADIEAGEDSAAAPASQAPSESEQCETALHDEAWFKPCR
jgi:hypothetical protein